MKKRDGSLEYLFPVPGNERTNAERADVVTVLLVQTRMTCAGKRLFGLWLRVPTLTVSHNHLIDPLTARYTMPFHRPSVSREFRHHQPAASMTAIERRLPPLIRFVRH
jgi:hypothetical protein